MFALKQIVNTRKIFEKKLINYCIIHIEYKEEKNDQFQMKKKKRFKNNKWI